MKRFYIGQTVTVRKTGRVGVVTFIPKPKKGENDPRYIEIALKKYKESYFPSDLI